MKAGDDVEDTVTDDQAVDPSPLLPQYADRGPQVDCKGDQADWNVCKKVTSRLGHIHLNCHSKKRYCSISENAPEDLDTAVEEVNNQGCSIFFASQVH